MPANEDYGAIQRAFDVRARWSDPQPPPLGVTNLVLQASMTAWGGGPSVSDGVNPVNSDFPTARSSGTKLISIDSPEGKTVTITVDGITVDGSVNKGYGEFSWNFSAGVDTRLARVLCYELGGYAKKADTPVLTNYAVPDYNWEGATTQLWPYSRYAAESVSPMRMQGSALIDRRILGLPTGETIENWDHIKYVRNNLQNLTFSGVASYRDPGYIYTLSNSRGGSYSGAIPDADGNAAIESLPPVKTRGAKIYVVVQESATYTPNKEPFLTANFNVSWLDGVSAEGEMVLTFVDEYANESQFGGGLITTSQTPQSYVFDSGNAQELIGTGLKPRKIRFSNDGTEFRAIQGAVAVATPLVATVQPEAALVLALLGASMTFG